MSSFSRKVLIPDHVPRVWIHSSRLVTRIVLSPSSPTEPSGSWDSIHVFETAERGRQALAQGGACGAGIVHEA